MLVLVNVVTPPPTEADHARAVAGAAWPQAPEAAPDQAEPIRTEHTELRAHLDHLRALADAVETSGDHVLRDRLRQVVRFLRDSILPHAATEEETIYPAVDRLLRALGGATATMVLEHELIGARVEELDRLAATGGYDAATGAELHRSLTALEAVLRCHFEKEELVYVPLLAYRIPAESAALAAQLAAAAPKAHEH